MVTITRGHPAASDFVRPIEAVWGPARAELAERLREHGEALESAHWQWTHKADRPPHWHCLVTAEHDGQVQGVMAAENLLRPARLTLGASVLYVDFIEAAPWNFRVPQNPRRPAAREPRFKRVGSLLIGEAVRMSLGCAEAGGRVGLHALAQAEAFYVARCGMTGLGPDPNYYDLAYFEYTDGTAGEHSAALEEST